MLVVDTAMKRAMKGDFDLFGKAEKLYDSLDKITDGKTSGEGYFEEKLRYIRNFKKAILLLIRGASKTFEKSLVNEQEVLNNIAVMIMETYVTESSALRVQKMEGIKGKDAVALYRDILDVLVYDSADRVRKSAMDAIYAFATDSEASKLAKAANILTVVAGVNTKEARRRIATKLIEDNCYKF